MNNALNEYEKWLNYGGLDAELREELEAIRGDEAEIAERFSCPMEFGTGGLRSVIRAGLNGMNIYTVRQATQGLADLIRENGEKTILQGVVIAYDSRIKSDLFAKEAACVLAANGIKAYLFDALRPTPELSFAVRHLGAAAGIVITASHNPAKYNGYKAYWSDGGQLPPAEADMVYSFIKKVDIFGARTTDFDSAVGSGMIEITGSETDEAYYKAVMALSVNPQAWENTDLSVVYTPFHGAGNVPVREVLTRMGLKKLTVVAEQEKPDGRFPTVKSPNPENPEGFELACRYAKAEGADIIIGTDPDSDRTGLLLRNEKGEYEILNGNQIGVVIAQYILDGRRASGTMPDNGAIVKTIVTTNMIYPLAADYGVTVIDVLTGFKFIGEQIKMFEETGRYTYLFGFEESYGSLSGIHARDKDAVNACMLICEAAAYYKKQGRTLKDVLTDAYEKYGYYMESLVSVTHEGLEGLEKIKQLMKSIRASLPEDFCGTAVEWVRDYSTSEQTDMKTGRKTPLDFIKSNVLAFGLADGTVLTVRPSGTEPKIKAYIMTKGETNAAAQENVKKYEQAIRELLQ